MTPREQAKYLFDKFYQYANEEFEDNLNEYPGQVLSERRKIRKESSKQCALITVDEIIASMPKEPIISTLARVHVIMFWVEVKQEIEKL